MSSLASAPGARRLLVISLLARLPLVMLSLGLLVHTQRLTGSFATAGAVTGAYAVALAVGGPLLGRLVDGRGQRVVLLASAGAAALLLAAIAALPPGAAPAVLLALAAGIGFATPPVGACLRSLLPRLLPDAGAVRAAYALDASASELTWIAGPPLALGLGALWSTGAALALAGLGLFCATAAFAWQPASRGWRPAAGDAPRPRGGSLGSPAMRTLVLVLIAVGVLFGAVEVAVTAVAKLDGGSTAAAAPLLALWGAGSLAGGAVSARFGTPGLVPLLAALAAGHLALVAVGSLAALGAVLFVAGTAIAPTYAAVYAMVDDAAPAGTVTEAFAWLATAIGIGAAIGAAAAGALADHTGPAAAFVLAGAAGALALLTTLLRARTLPGREVAVLPVAAPAT
jgi:MFS family permease